MTTSLPRPGAVAPKPQVVRCWTCQHPWAAQVIEMIYEETHKAGNPRPSVEQVYGAVLEYHAQHGKKLGLAHPPKLTTITCHICKNGHSSGFRLWEGVTGE